jgi:hypothetical protein
MPCATLAPGECFVTPYGIVQVLRDDRATPTAVVTHPAAAKAKLKLYYSALAKRQARHQKQRLNVAVISRARRLLLQEAYVRSNGAVDAQEIQTIYDFCARVPAPSLPPRPALADPSAPPDAYPDRMVEGRLLPDTRPRYLGPSDATSLDFTLLEGRATDPTAARLFLSRRLLTTRYRPDAARYYCPRCYQCFASKPGYKYHRDHCRRAPADGGSVDARARQFVARYHSARPPAARPDAAHVRPPAADRLPPPAATAPISPRTEEDAPPDDDDDPTTFVSPDVILARLTAELHRHQGSLLGPMYPPVWSALGYRRPVAPKPKRARRDAAAVAAPILSETTERADLLSIVDVNPLVQEVDAGRYPSMQRYSGARGEPCCICKQPGAGPGDDARPLLPCSFCRQVEHFRCARTKFLVKYPEAGDDFLCHNCIGIIAARRSRAEKRRLEKLPTNSEEETSSGKSLPEHPSYSSTDPARLQEFHALTSGVVRDREFDCVAAQGSRLTEFSVLLYDAKTRLTLRLEGMSMNQTRHSWIETAYDGNDDAESERRPQWLG